jgi:hypothetical protein
MVRSLCGSVHYPVTSSFLYPYISLSLSQTGSDYVLPLTSETKFYTHSKQEVSVILYIYIFAVLDSRLEYERFSATWQQY